MYICTWWKFELMGFSSASMPAMPLQVKVMTYFSGGQPGWTSTGSIWMKRLLSARFISLLYSMARRARRGLKLMSLLLLRGL
jgi:hypothetical protein